MQGRWRSILYFPYFILASVWLILGFGYAAWFFKRRAHALLKLPEGTVLDRKQLRRLKQYFYGTSYLSFLFSMLRGSTRNQTERARFVQLSALAYHFDDLADAWQKTRTSGSNWQGSIKEYGAQADQTGIALHLLHQIERQLSFDQARQFDGYMERVFVVETAGRQVRKTSPLTETELLRITREKGGCSVLMFRMMQEHALSSSEEQVWYQFGGLIQLCDDIFDIWFDHQDGVTTVATATGTPDEVAALVRIFEAEVQATYAALTQTQYNARRRYTCWFGMHYLIAITRLCLEHYTLLANQNGSLPLHDRHALVVDMERWRNRIGAVKHVFRWSV